MKKVINKFFRRWIKSRKMNQPQDVQDVFRQRARFFVLQEEPHSAFLRPAPKHFNFRGHF